MDQLSLIRKGLETIRRWTGESFRNSYEKAKPVLAMIRGFIEHFTSCWKVSSAQCLATLN
jgi:hypothetical protein